MIIGFFGKKRLNFAMFLPLLLRSFFAVLRDDRWIRHEENEGAMQFPLSTVEQAPIL